jgi:hypothetical protein
VDIIVKSQYLKPVAVLLKRKKFSFKNHVEQLGTEFSEKQDPDLEITDGNNNTGPTTLTATARQIYGSIHLQSLKIVNYWLYSLMHKKIYLFK